MIPLEYLLLGVAVMLLLSVVSSKASTQLGVPTLVLFLLIGMLAGGLGQGGNGGLKAMVTNLLDADDDGSIIDEVGDLLGGFLKR